jgi:methyl-accepting chemotaxis protein
VLLPSVVVLSIALSLLVTMAVRNSLLSEVREIGAAALGLGQGNLMVRSREYGNDEIGETSRALDHSIRHLNTTLSTILNSAKSIDDASRDILQGSAALTSRAEAQANSIEETTASMQALAATLNQTAGNAQVANQLALCAANFAFKGGSVVERLVVTMDSIRGSSRKVVEIVGVIDAISSQTNALAISAAAEAERAGEHGAGFAAVAGEVRTLAQRSAVAAQEIKTLIAESALHIEGGSRSAGEAGSRLAEISESVHQVGAIVDMISQSSSQQVQGLSDVSNAIVQMEQMTKQNSALVEAAAAKAASLQNQALGLSLAVASFQLGDGMNLEVPGPAKKNAGQGSGARLRLAASRVELPQGHVPQD